MNKLRNLSCVGALAAVAAGAALFGGVVRTRAQAPPKPDLAAQAKSVLAQHSGTIVVKGLSQPVEVLL